MQWPNIDSQSTYDQDVDAFNKGLQDPLKGFRGRGKETLHIRGSRGSRDMVNLDLHSPLHSPPHLDPIAKDAVSSVTLHQIVLRWVKVTQTTVHRVVYWGIPPHFAHRSVHWSSEAPR